MNTSIKPWRISADDFPADGSTTDQLEFLLGYAILAPSLYNTQPWLFRINIMDVELLADQRRALNVVDPNGRERIMSCGSALCNLRIAAEYFGHQYDMTRFPDANNPNFLVRFHQGLRGETSSEDVLLFHAITQRRTNRHPFEDKPVPEEILEALVAAAEACGAWFYIVRDETLRQTVANLVTAGDRRQWTDKQFRTELARWIRTKPAASRDGLPLGSLGIKNWLSFAGAMVVRNFDRGGKLAAADSDLLAHSPVLGVLGTETEDPPAWLNAGEAIERILLGAQAEGVSASFLNQPIQIPDLRGQLAEALGTSGFPQSLVRLGYGPEVSATPRRSVREVLVMHKTVHA